VGEGRPEFFEKKKVFDTHEILFKKFLPEYKFFFVPLNRSLIGSSCVWVFKTKLNALKKKKEKREIEKRRGKKS
jgi:hypothetical protein